MSHDKEILFLGACALLAPSFKLDYTTCDCEGHVINIRRPFTPEQIKQAMKQAEEIREWT